MLSLTWSTHDDDEDCNAVVDKAKIEEPLDNYNHLVEKDPEGDKDQPARSRSSVSG